MMTELGEIALTEADAYDKSLNGRTVSVRIAAELRKCSQEDIYQLIAQDELTAFSYWASSPWRKKPIYCVHVLLPELTPLLGPGNSLNESTL